MKITTMKLGLLGANCYIIETEKKNAVAIDIGGEAEKVISYINQNNLNLKKILLTHGHYDHIMGVSDVKNKTNAEVFIHNNDVLKLNDSYENLGYFSGITKMQPIDNYITIDNGDCIKQDELDFKVIHTPGHTAGCVCYICNDNIFSGDTLFKCSIGRTDFPDSNIKDMFESLKKLKNLKGDYNIYPGHEDNSTLNYEKKNNPYFKENPYDNYF